LDQAVGFGGISLVGLVVLVEANEKVPAALEAKGTEPTYNGVDDGRVDGSVAGPASTTVPHADVLALQVVRGDLQPRRAVPDGNGDDDPFGGTTRLARTGM
jgi:hypothetical protein